MSPTHTDIMQSMKLAGTILAFTILLMLSMHTYYSGMIERFDQTLELPCDKHTITENELQDRAHMRNDILSQVKPLHLTHYK